MDIKFIKSKLVLKAKKALKTELKPAAVLIPIINDPKGLLILFTERTQNLKNHAGQISFPGGRMESGDTNLQKTAIREAYEEIGIDSQQIEIIGQLDAWPSTTGFMVTPFVGLINPPLSLNLDPKEVATVFTVPLDFVLDAKNYQQEDYLYQNQKYPIFILNYENHRIWGLTARILVDLANTLKK